MVQTSFINGYIRRNTLIPSSFRQFPHTTNFFTVAARVNLGNILRRSLVQLSPGRLRIMAPPKQATLGYVKGRQGTLGCVNRR